MSAVSVSVDLDRAEPRGRTRWYPADAHATGFLNIGSDLMALGDSSARWRELAAAAARIADEIDDLNGGGSPQPPPGPNADVDGDATPGGAR